MTSGDLIWTHLRQGEGVIRPDPEQIRAYSMAGRVSRLWTVRRPDYRTARGSPVDAQETEPRQGELYVGLARSVHREAGLIRTVQHYR